MPSSHSTSKQATGNGTAWKDRRTVLSALWVFLVLNFLYADVFSLFFDPAASTPIVDMSGSAIFFFAVVMETSIAMVLLARFLPRGWNRWTNVGAAALQIALLVYSLTSGTVTSFYAFFAAIEIATLLFVAGYAWTWRSQPQPERVALGATAA